MPEDHAPTIPLVSERLAHELRDTQVEINRLLSNEDRLRRDLELTINELERKRAESDRLDSAILQLQKVGL